MGADGPRVLDAFIRRGVHEHPGSRVRQARDRAEAVGRGVLLPRGRAQDGDAPLSADVVHEFDSLDQLQSFDPEFIDNVGSGVLDNICSTLGCLRGDIVDVRPSSRA